MNKSKILLVMEQSSFRDELIQELGCNGFEVVNAYDGLEAIKLLRKNSFDGIIAQFSIKRADALELILNIKDFTRKIPIIVIDFKKSNMEEEVKKAGATHFFYFPVNIKTIVKLLK